MFINNCKYVRASVTSTSQTEECKHRSVVEELKEDKEEMSSVAGECPTNAPQKRRPLAEEVGLRHTHGTAAIAFHR